MQFFATGFHGQHEMCFFQDCQVLGYALACHVQVRAEFGQGLAVVGIEDVQKQSPIGVGEGFEESVVVWVGLGHRVVAKGN